MTDKITGQWDAGYGQKMMSLLVRKCNARFDDCSYVIQLIKCKKDNIIKSWHIDDTCEWIPVREKVYARFDDYSLYG